MSYGWLGIETAIGLMIYRGSLFNPEWFGLDSSRGFESASLKVFMRASVLISEYLIYIPALVILIRKMAKLGGVNNWESSIALVAILLQPATMIIDHAHFQYNTVMLGFTLASLSSMLAGRYLWSCVFFVASLGFKQMALYYAPVVFAYLTGVCFQPKIDIIRFLGISVTTLLSFAVLFAPLLLGASYNHYRDPELNTTLPPPELFSVIQSLIPLNLDQSSFLYPGFLHLAQSIHRVFPLARGLFEDKVANIWCALHTIYKLNRFSIPTLSRISLLATLVAITPACITIALSPRKKALPYALASCAWGFFLCSFQVHEKSVLLPLLPMTILLGGEGGLAEDTRAWVGWANALGVWTMFPLLKRDELRIPYAVLSLLWAWLLDLPPASFSLYTKESKGLPLSVRVLHLEFYLVMAVWHIIEAFIPPPQTKPDLWVIANCILGATGFGFCYLWCTWRVLLNSGSIGYLESLSAARSGKEKTTGGKKNGEKKDIKSQRKTK